MFRFALRLLLIALLIPAAVSMAAPSSLSVVDYPSIQAALDANPGRQVFVPAGDHVIDKTIVINVSDSGLYGPGRIIQNDPTLPIIHINKAERVQVRDLTLTRPAGKQETKAFGLLAEYCTDVVLENLQILENHGGTSLRITFCSTSQIRNCLVRNYTGITVDDRTSSPLWGYAFNCIDGTGIQVDDSSGTLVQGNRVIEKNLLATPEMKKQHDLGKIIKFNETPGRLMKPEHIKRGSVNNWHQGSGILFSSPRISDGNQLIGNYVENAGQGFDIHCDHVVIANNIVNKAFIGMKAMHGARNVLISSNQFRNIDLWGILLQPGSMSSPGSDATTTQTAQAPNVDGGTIIANNIISDFGYGNEYWVWKTEDSPASCVGILIYAAQDPVNNPPLQDVIITGNVMYDPGRDRILQDGKLVVAPPRFKYAIYIEDTQATKPRNVIVSNNIFHKGSVGVSNVDLARYAQPQ